MKVISMYLPQFHRTKENDEWWGEGFTDWTTVMHAKKLVENHYQPRVPLNDNYYNLLEKEIMVWQADLMRKYGIDAQCFYHYWFKDGRQVLEQPAENLLRWKDIDMPYCFCWANETWARTWSKLSNKNPWASVFEKKGDMSDSGILLEQKYGDKEQWKQHFEYLKDFFGDSRYIKVDNKPVFLIYQPTLIPCLSEMLDQWNQWVLKYGFSGIYTIGANSNYETDKKLDAILYHEPQHIISLFNYRRPDRKNIQVLDYNEIWKEILEFSSSDDKAIYGGFVGYDDTPRRGREGVIVENADPKKFQIYLTELMAKNMAAHKEFIFINAWNEWGEGMYLEPDHKYAYDYLEAVKYAKRNYAKYIDKYKGKNKRKRSGLEKELEFWSSKSARYEGYWRILDAWLYLKEEQMSLEEYFIERNVHTIAVYGMGILGRHLRKELESSSICIKYIIDRKADALLSDAKVYAPDDDFPEADMIVVTATYAYMEIRKQLEKRGYKNVVSLDEIIDKLSDKIH